MINPAAGDRRASGPRPRKQRGGQPAPACVAEYAPAEKSLSGPGAPHGGATLCSRMQRQKKILAAVGAGSGGETFWNKKRNTEKGY